MCAAALFVLGALVQRGLVDRIRDSPHEMQILLLLGVALVLENAALVAFGPDPQRVRSSLSGATLWIGPVFVDLARLAAFAVALALTCALWLFLRRTDLGRTMRATADNPYGALVVGTTFGASTPRRSGSARRASGPPGRWSRRSSRSRPRWACRRP